MKTKFDGGVSFGDYVWYCDVPERLQDWVLEEAGKIIQFIFSGEGGEESSVRVEFGNVLFGKKESDPEYPHIQICVPFGLDKDGIETSMDCNIRISDMIDEVVEEWSQSDTWDTDDYFDVIARDHVVALERELRSGADKLAALLQANN